GALTISGEKGTVKIGGQYLNELETWNVEGIPMPDYDQSRKANEYGRYQGSMSNHDLVYQNVEEVINNNAPIKANSIHGALCIKSIEMIYEKIR
ncbi:hypothetical protein OAE02_00160, partial [Akkermansiaceae bacterium]|nr:hypothetical protein [Akkermansiaceae bacterium]